MKEIASASCFVQTKYCIGEGHKASANKLVDLEINLKYESTLTSSLLFAVCRFKMIKKSNYKIFTKVSALIENGSSTNKDIKRAKCNFKAPLNQTCFLWFEFTVKETYHEIMGEPDEAL